ncbi:MAG TPA: hypothetical protein VGI06_13275, partial [Acidimicrobiales bacterium]
RGRTRLLTARSRRRHGTASTPRVRWSAMGRGARPVRRWKNDRIRNKKAREHRKLETARATVAERHAAAAATAPASPSASA